MTFQDNLQKQEKENLSEKNKANQLKLETLYPKLESEFRVFKTKVIDLIVKNDPNDFYKNIFEGIDYYSVFIEFEDKYTIDDILKLEGIDPDDEFWTLHSHEGVLLKTTWEQISNKFNLIVTEINDYLSSKDELKDVKAHFRIVQAEGYHRGLDVGVRIYTNAKKLESKGYNVNINKGQNKRVKVGLDSLLIKKDLNEKKNTSSSFISKVILPACIIAIYVYFFT